MPRTSWFDETTAVPVIEERARALESFTAALADGVVEQRELDEQQARLVAAMKAVEPELSDELHEKVTTLLVELSAYDILRLLHELQAAHLRAVMER